MLDPLTSLALAGNILQLVDFGSKCIKHAREIAENGSTEEQRHLKFLTTDLSSVSKQIGNQGNDEALHNLATRTHNVTEELSHLLKKVHIDEQEEEQDKARSRKRKRSVVKCVIQSAWKRNDIKNLEHNLNDLRQQMVLRLSAAQSQSLSDVLTHLGVPGNTVHKERNELLSLCERRMNKLQDEDVVTKAPGSELDQEFDVLSFLKGMATQAREVVRCQHILRLLAYEDIRSREETIPHAHQSTFEWIFQNEDLGFMDWAVNKNGIFWITGKPGSGKSTLMKYLVSHPRTHMLLRQWAGLLRLGMASHYFWNPGTAIQKSELGLLRKLLYDIVSNFPAEALKVIPPSFEDGNMAGDMMLTTNCLRETLEAFGNTGDLGTKICLFIDGLDEYDNDHHHLIQCLSKLSRCPSIKLCVSSRPWNVFNKAYNGRVEGQIAMQELTRADIKKFIDDRMNASDPFKALRETNPRDCVEILAEICEKAQGVFLWVHIVIRSILRGLHDNDDSIDVLRERVREYPDTLEGYFHRMFQRIENVYKKQSARMFLVALAAEGKLPLETPLHLEKEMANPDYALQMPMDDRGQFLDGSYHKGECKVKKQDEGARVTRVWIDARCGDLLEVKRKNIHFLHRTARDFLRQEHIMRTLRKLSTTESFDEHISLTRLRLAQLIKSEWPRMTVEMDSLLEKVLESEAKVPDSRKTLYANLLAHIDYHWCQLFGWMWVQADEKKPAKHEKVAPGVYNPTTGSSYGTDFEIPTPNLLERVESALKRMGRPVHEKQSLSFYGLGLHDLPLDTL